MSRSLIRGLRAVYPKSVRFTIIDPEAEVKALSIQAEEKQKPDIRFFYQPQQGFAQDQTRCGTCSAKTYNQCLGHEAKIELAVPVFHVSFINKYILQILRCVCPECCKLLITEEGIKKEGFGKYSEQKRLQQVSQHLKKQKASCSKHGEVPQYSYKAGNNYIEIKSGHQADVGARKYANDVLGILESISDDAYKLLGFSDKSKAVNMILKELNVIPPCYRPMTSRGDGKEGHDPLTETYHKILTTNTALKEAVGDPQRMKLEEDLFKAVSSIIESSEQASSRRPMKEALKNKIGGKTGLFRRNMLGKRINHCARSVLGPDPSLPLDTVGLPDVWENVLTYPEPVSRLNIGEMQKLVNEDKVAEIHKAGKDFNRYQNVADMKEEDKKLQIGDIVNRYMRNGDIVYFNRNPTLHKGSLMAYKVKFLPGDTIRLNPAAVTPHGADFDGDEGNIYVPQSIGARVEAMSRSIISQCLISAQNSRPMVGLIQDSLTYSYLMTQRVRKIEIDPDTTVPNKIVTYHVLVDKEVFYDCLAAADIDLGRLDKHRRKCQWYGIPFYSGRSLFSLLFPEDFEYHKLTDTDPDEPIVEIREGILISGVMDKKVLGPVPNSIIQTLVKWPGAEGTKVAVKFITALQKLVNHWGQTKGFTTGITDCMRKGQTAAPREGASPQGVAEVLPETAQDREIRALIREARLFGEKARGTSPLQQKRYETLINDALCRASDIAQKYAKEEMGQESSFFIMERSGARGSWGNIVNITSLIGQQNVQGGRIPVDREGRTLTSFDRYDPRPKARGFCQSSFTSGLDPDEHFFHMMASREQVMTGIVKTAETGYMGRTFARLMDSLRIHYDNTVRNSKGEIIQEIYGGDGFDATRLVSVNGRAYFTDVKFLARRLNAARLTQRREEAQAREEAKSKGEAPPEKVPVKREAPKVPAKTRSATQSKIPAKKVPAKKPSPKAQKPLPFFDDEAVRNASKNLNSPIPYSELKMASSTTRSSSLMPWHIVSNNSAIKKCLDDQKIKSIVDVRAHVGIDTINFAQIFRAAKITAVELDPYVCGVLKENVKAAGVGARVNVICGNGVDTVLGLKSVDLVFLDPPWGGEKYKSQDKTPLELTDSKGSVWTMPRLVSELFDKGITTKVFLKAPENYSDDSVFTEASGTRGATESKWKVEKFPVENMTQLSPPKYSRVSYYVYCITKI